jgi:TFIIH p62 subunit, N-terminal domain
VIFKKIACTVVLSEDSLRFLADVDQDKPSKDAFKTVKWEDVAKHQTSPTSHSKARLKLILHTGNNLLFKFASRDDLSSV